MTPLRIAEGRKMSIGDGFAVRDARFEPEAGAASVPCGGHKAAKSAFLRILNKNYRRDGGEMCRDGREVECGSLAEALARGVPSLEPDYVPLRRRMSPRVSSSAANRLAGSNWRVNVQEIELI